MKFVAWRRVPDVFAGGKLLATYGGTDTYFALIDWLGTKRVETDSAGNSVSTSYSLPFGDNLVVNGGPDATEHHFTGKEHDSNTGNDFFLARYYNSATGRFLSPDWSKNPEGVPYADFIDPQSPGAVIDAKARSILATNPASGFHESRC